MPSPGFKSSFPEYYAKYGNAFRGNRSDSKKFLFREFCKIAKGDAELKDHKDKAFKLARESCASVGQVFKFSDANENFLSDLEKGNGHRAKAAALHFYLLTKFSGHGKNVSGHISGEETGETGPGAGALEEVPAQLVDETETLDSREAFYIYEAAFLWHGMKPPNKYLHHLYMPQEVEDTKAMLHDAYQLDFFEAAPDHEGAQQTGFVVSRDELKRFAESFEMRPAFIFPENHQSNAELMQGRRLLFNTISEKFAELLVPVSDWSKHDSENAWPVYQATFLWHEFEPPLSAIHDRVMTDEIRATKEMLHSAIEAGKLDVKSEYFVGTAGVRYVERTALKEFAKKLKQRPRFLFPHENEARSSK